MSLKVLVDWTRSGFTGNFTGTANLTVNAAVAAATSGNFTGAANLTVTATTTASPDALVRVNHIQSTFNVGGASKSLSSTFDVQNGDLITVIGYTSDSVATLATPTWDGTGTVALQRSSTGVTSPAARSNMYLWSIPVTAAATGRNITIGYTGSSLWGFTATVWRNHGGIGNTAVATETGASGAPLLNLTVGTNSAVETGIDDIAAIDGTSRTWRTVNALAMSEQLYFRSAATSPTFVSYTDSGDWTTSRATGSVYTVSSVAVQTGDVLLVFAGVNDSPNQEMSTPSGGGLTYSLRIKPCPHVVSGHADSWLWTATATSSATFNVTSTLTSNITDFAGLAVYVWRNATVGTIAGNDDAGTTPSLSITPGASNSAIVYFASDTAAADGTSRTWRTINGSTPTSGNGLEKLYARNTSQTVYSAYWANAGVAGTQTTGLTAPTGQTPNAIAVELQPSGGGGYTVYGGYRMNVGTAGTVSTGLTAPSTQAWSAVGAEILPVGGTTSSGTWLSGASADGSNASAANGNFAIWRNKAVGIGGTWLNETPNYPFATGGTWANWNGPMDVGVSPISWSGWAAEAAGFNDTFWTNLFTTMATLRAGKGTTYVRPYYEFNGTWMPWTVNSGDIANFKTAWNRTANIARTQFPTVKVLLGSAAANGALVSDCWPTATVDALSIDFYNNWPWVTDQTGFDSKIENAAGANSLEDLRRLAQTKGVPVAISEWSNDGKVKPAGQGGGGESPGFIDSFYSWCSTNAGTGPGQLLYEVLFNLWADQYEFFDGVSTTSVQPNTANRYKLSTRFGG